MLVATDLDGTLLRSDHTVSSRTAAAMAAARDAGIEIVWATARARHSVGDLACAAGFRGLAVCANGAVALDLADGTPVVTGTVDIEIEAAAAAMKAVREVLPGVVFANVGPTSFVAEPRYAALCEFVDHYRHPHEMDLADALPSIAEPMVKIVARHPDVPAAELYRMVLASAVPGIAVTHSGAPYIEMAASGVSKAAALAELCAVKGISVDQVAAAGDAVNDIPMLEWAGTALAPANALPEVAALAHRMLPSNDDDGVAHFLEQLVASR
nr:HAD-IIB family hydrolase [Rhodococcus sp. HNM0569]